VHCPVRFPALSAAVHRRFTSSAVTQLASCCGDRAAVRTRVRDVHQVLRESSAVCDADVVEVVVEAVLGVEPVARLKFGVYGLVFRI